MDDRKPAAQDLKTGFTPMKERVTQPPGLASLLSNLGEVAASPGSASRGIKMPPVHNEAPVKPSRGWDNLSTSSDESEAESVGSLVPSSVGGLSNATESAQLAGLVMKFNAVATIVMDLRADARAKDASLTIVIKGLKAKIKEQRSQIKALTTRLDQGRGTADLFGEFAPQNPDRSATMSARDRKIVAEEVASTLGLTNYVTHQELDGRRYVNHSEFGSRLSSSLGDRLSSLERDNILPGCLAEQTRDRLAIVESDLMDSDGVVPKMKKMLSELRDRKVGSAISIGGYTFRDQSATEAWAQTLGDGNLITYFCDCRLQLGLLQVGQVTANQILKEEADAAKAKYDSAASARAVISFAVTFPESMFRQSTSNVHAANDGVVFSAPFSSAEVFEGALETGTKANILQALSTNRERRQTAINSRFPPDQPKHTKSHAICSEILRKGYFQAVGLVESMLPFYKMMTGAGLGSKEAWDNKECTYLKAVFRRVYEVRTVSTEQSIGAMIYGMLRATNLLDDYTALDWIRHPDVSSALVVASLQREGKQLTTVVSEFRQDKATIKKNKDGVESLKEDWKKFKNKNQSLNF